MAIVVQKMDLKDFDVIPGINSPTQLYEIQAGVALASAYPLTTLVFPDNVLSAAFFTFSTGAIGGTPALSVAVDWYLASGSTAAANVRFGAAVAPLGFAGGATFPANGNVTTTALQTAVLVTSAVTVATSPVPFSLSRAAISPTVPGSFVTANGPFVVGLKVFRDGTDVLDTATGDVKVRGITVLYQDT